MWGFLRQSARADATGPETLIVRYFGRDGIHSRSSTYASTSDASRAMHSLDISYMLELYLLGRNNVIALRRPTSRQYLIASRRLVAYDYEMVLEVEIVTLLIRM